MSTSNHATEIETLIKTRQQLIEQKNQIKSELTDIDSKLDSICHHTQVVKCIKKGSNEVNTYKCGGCGLPAKFYLWSVIIRTEYI